MVACRSPHDRRMKDAVIRMRERGGKQPAAIALSVPSMPTSVVRTPRSTSQQLKEPDLVLPTFTAQQIRQLVTWKPKEQNPSGVCVCSLCFYWIPAAASRRRSR